MGGRSRLEPKHDIRGNMLGPGNVCFFRCPMHHTCLFSRDLSATPDFALSVCCVLHVRLCEIANDLIWVV